MKSEKKELSIGGQAVIEGVMMKGERNVSVAMRLLDGKIKVHDKRIGGFIDEHRWLKFPFIRGITNLIQMLYIGMWALFYSANEQVDEKEKEKLTVFHLVISLLMALFFALLLFKLLPLGITKLLQHYNLIGSNRFVFNLIDGAIRIIIFIAYILVISLMKDVRLLFQYHGAEHKAVNCYEAKKKLTLENVKKYSTIHRRCGTSFMLLVLLIAILVFSLVPVTLPFFVLLAYRLPLILPIASIAYELLKLGSRYPKNPFFLLLVRPGMFLQKITTREPDEKQMEVAIAAINGTLNAEST